MHMFKCLIIIYLLSGFLAAIILIWSMFEFVARDDVTLFRITAERFQPFHESVSVHKVCPCFWKYINVLFIHAA